MMVKEPDMAEVTLSSKNQIVVPREARDALGLKPGAKLIVVARGDTIILMRKPRSFARALRGIGKGVYPVGYPARERESW
jgi:AbrB family looped-hinge helix DNA binding protein